MSKRQFLSKLLKAFGEKVGNKDPVGRSLAYCYGHALEADPTLRKEILGNEITKLLGSHIDPEQWEVKVDAFQFKGVARKKRRPDIYIVHKNDPVAIIEIKVEDQDEDDSDGQLADYVKFCKKSRTPFFYLTKYALGPEEKRLLKQLPRRAFHRRHSEIRDALKRREQKNHIAEMISTYLEDKEMQGYQPLKAEKKDLLNFARRFLPVHAGGLGRTHSKRSVHSIGQIVSQCLTNITIVGEWLRVKNERKFRGSFLTYPRVFPYWDVGKLMDDKIGETLKKIKNKKRSNGVEASTLRKKLKQALKYEWEIESSYSDGGEIYFAAEGRFSASNLGVWIAIFIELDKSAKSPLTSGLYVEFWGGSIQKISNNWDEYDGDRWHPEAYEKWDLGKSEDDTRRKLLELLSKAQKRLRNLRKHPDPSLRRFGASKEVSDIAAMQFPGIQV